MMPAQGREKEFIELEKRPLPCGRREQRCMPTALMLLRENLNFWLHLFSPKFH